MQAVLSLQSSVPGLRVRPYVRAPKSADRVDRRPRTVDCGPRSPQKELVRRVLVLERVGIRELVEERAERGQVALLDFEPREHTTEVRTVIPVVKQADVP